MFFPPITRNENEKKARSCCHNYLFLMSLLPITEISKDDDASRVVKMVNIRATLKQSERFTMFSSAFILPASACESVKNEQFETCKISYIIISLKHIC